MQAIADSSILESVRWRQDFLSVTRNLADWGSIARGY